jgi:hypothetical protein
MAKYSFFIWNKHSRVRYPRTLDLPDVDAARQVASRIASIFVDVVPHWDDFSFQQRNTFVVEIVGETVLTIPFREAKQPAS